ncbi:MAG: carbamoyltransferase HypF [Candidatus Binatia bacterium]
MRGIVQGVGFRPFVFFHARRRALRGRVLNNPAGVLIDVEGESYAIEQFIQELQSNPPPLSRIDSVDRSDDLPAANFIDFRIAGSSANGKRDLPVSVDTAACEPCLKEMFDPSNRRYRYPFINCTDCGPRFTIIEDVPYDRPTTTMRDFIMCAECRTEYEDPLDRRFHAEATGCSRCGPRLSLADSGGREQSPGGINMIDLARRYLLDGKILAIKGIGGFHLACDALDQAAVERLRRRKFREGKPFAMMAASLEAVRQFCLVSRAESDLLLCARRPIVLLKKKFDAPVPAAVAPGVNTLGFMLPYSPLHHLLFERLDRPLIMTSGNLSDEPIQYRDRDAFERLGKIADYFLLHNRRIHVRSDDSVMRVRAEQPIALRRSRGYAPEALKVRFQFGGDVLACGGQLKNTFCLGKKEYAFISHHIGDLENFETLTSFSEGIQHFQRLFDIRPSVVAHDLHPDYLSTMYALGLKGVDRVGVQHHHAHIASCMVENGLDSPVIGVAFDGSGFGEDGAIWGGEVLVADLAHYERRAHFRYVPLAGGDTAIRQPWRAALSYIQDALGTEALPLELPGWREIDPKKIRVVQSMIRRGVNTVATSSCGRLFDAVSSLLGLRHDVSYEAQAAIELESVAMDGISDLYPFDINGDSPQEIDVRAAIRSLLGDLRHRRPAGLISAKFHNTVSAIVVELCRKLRQSEGLNRVCLSGGVFQNMYLLERVLASLERDGFDVFHQRKLPTNDGGIALGQAAIANRVVQRGS